MTKLDSEIEQVTAIILLKGVFKAVRAQNLAILVFAQYFTAIFLGSEGNDWLSVFQNPDLFLLSISTVSIAAAGYIINDYYDIKIDLINHPDTVIVGKEISRRNAMALHTIFNIIGIGIGIFLDPLIGAINFVSAFFLWWYSNYLKRLPFTGNFVIGILTGTSIIVVGFLYPDQLFLIFVYAFFAGTYTLIREIIKDLEDLVGDERFGYKTLPVVWGARGTKQFLYVLVLVFTISVVYFSTSSLGPYWIHMNVVLLVLDIIFIFRLYKADTKKDFSWLSQFCKVVMLIGVLSMIFV